MRFSRAVSGYVDMSLLKEKKQNLKMHLNMSQTENVEVDTNADGPEGNCVEPK